jgi:hypothetical protein
MIEDFWNELSEGEIHVRDSLQFELKSEFFINPHLKTNVYKQEVFLFIPSPLQINPQTYSKQQFYLDQTNLIRYKTPPMTLSELVNPNHSFSPLNRLFGLFNHPKANFFVEVASDEVKLFAAIFRSTLRERVYTLVTNLMQPSSLEAEKFSHSITLLCSEIEQVTHQFRDLQELAKTQSYQPQLIRHFKYVDEFISSTIDEFLVILLKQLRSLEQQDSRIDKQICQLILKEKLYREKMRIGPKTSKGHLFATESVLYRQGLLNRFVMESLMLKNTRFSLEEKHTHILGATAAGIAMFVYMILFFVWNTSGFVINSFPIVVLAVFLYILKDRIKEGFKTLYYKQAHRWFPDYSTEIRSPKGLSIGKLTENFAFIEPKQLPPGFSKIRNRHFHEELQALQRHETIIQYKREMTLNPPPSTETRRRELTSIFRLNIHHFLQKISDAFQPDLTLDAYTQEITEKLLPKVYHLNIIIRNTYLQDDLTPKIEIKTFRVVMDKNGIKRVEHIRPLA